MILLLTGLMQAVASATTPSPSPSVVPVEALWLAGGGLVGALIRAFFIKHQNPLSRETGFDAFIGLGIGFLWTVPMLSVWPPFELSDRASYPQRAFLVAIFVVISVEIIKRVLIKWAPDFLERRLGAVLPKNGNEKPA